MLILRNRNIKRYLYLIILISFVIGTGFWYYNYRNSNLYLFNTTKQLDTEPYSSYNVSIEENIQVEIAGNIKFPGIYNVTNKNTLNDIVNNAGGFIDELNVNLSNSVFDGEFIDIPFDNNIIQISYSNDIMNKKLAYETFSKKEITNPININQATAPELTMLPNIGEVLAERIVEYREKNGFFSQISDIKNVSGIGDKKFEDMKDLITVD